jgi:hypothetical protein
MMHASIRSERIFCCFLSKRPNYIQTSKFIESRLNEPSDAKCSACSNSACRNSSNCNPSDLLFYSAISQFPPQRNCLPVNDSFLPRNSQTQGYIEFKPSHFEANKHIFTDYSDAINYTGFKHNRTHFDLRVSLDGTYPSKAEILKLKKARDSRSSGFSSNSTLFMQNGIFNANGLLTTLSSVPSPLPQLQFQPSTSTKAVTTKKNNNSKDKRPSPDQLRELILRLESEIPRVIHTFSIHQVNYLSPNLIFENHMGYRQRVYQYALGTLMFHCSVLMHFLALPLGHWPIDII